MLVKKLRRRIALLLCKSVQFPRIIFYQLLSGNSAIGALKKMQPVQLNGLGTIRFAANVRIGYFPSPAYFSTYAYIDARHPSSAVIIGDNTSINNNFTAIAEFTSITIGSNCLIGANVEILDSDFHGLKVSDRGISKPESAKPVLIGDNVFLGSNCKIMKGVCIGDGAVVANGSLVTGDVPKNALFGGVPAKFIKTIE